MYYVMYCTNTSFVNVSVGSHPLFTAMNGSFWMPFCFFRKHGVRALGSGIVAKLLEGYI